MEKKMSWRPLGSLHPMTTYDRIEQETTDDDMSITVNDLSADQREAYNSIIGWVEDAEYTEEGGILTLGGVAGSGKSTLISLVAERVNLPAFCAYTGKAASVLKRKLAAAGIQTVGPQRKREGGGLSLDERPFCGTIHSLIYRMCSCREPRVVKVNKPCPEKGCIGETRWENEQSVCAKGHVGLVKTTKAFEALEPREVIERAARGDDGRCKLCFGKEWFRRETLDRDYSLIIVDEASMVDDAMLGDLRGYGVPILAVGDHGQLPPVGGAGALMRDPQIRLEKTHRQAEGNPIIALSKIIRETGRIPEDFAGGDAVTFARLRELDRLLEDRYADATPERLLEMGIVCYTNRRRVGLNVAVRRARGTARVGRELPRKGEHVVCLRNMKPKMGTDPIYNGMRGVLGSDAIPKLVRDPHGEFKNDRGEPCRESKAHLMGTIAFPEDDIAAREYEMLRAQFGRDKTYSEVEELQRETGISSFGAAGALFDFGFAMTCHKMQGSQVDDLVVLVERPGPVSDADWAKWIYTATTRSAAKLTILR